MRIVLILWLGCALSLFCWHQPRPASATLAGPSDSKTYQFVNGRWFDGRKFQRRVFYSAGGILTSRKPDVVDHVIDLQGGYVVPPFGDAHTHYIAGPHDIDKIIRQYLQDGIFYAKNPASIYRDTAQIRSKINRPDSVDVVFANAVMTASGGHPVALYEHGGSLGKVKKPGPDGTFENLAYYIVDNESDLKQKWPLMLQRGTDLVKLHLLYSEEFEKRRDNPAYFGNRGMNPKLLPLVVAKAHAAHLPVACHIETAADFRNALAAGVDEIAHLPGYYPDLAHPDWFPITSRDAALAAAKRVDVVTTTYVSAAELKKPDELKRAREIQIHNLRLLKAARVKLAIGPDVYGATALAEAMNLYDLRVFDNLTLLKMWCEATPKAIFPARKIGRLRDGYEASFLVLRGDPLANFENVKDIELRFKQGHYIDAKELKLKTW